MIVNNLETIKAVRAAIKTGDVDRMGELLNESQDLIRHMTPFGTWLHYAVEFGNASVIEKLIGLGLDVNLRGGTFNGTAINLAASAGHIEVVKLLLDSGAILDTSESERNPLFGAIYVSVTVGAMRS